MATQVQLGNFFSSGGKTVLGGVGGSGLDTEGLINSLAEAKALPATRLQDKIDLNDKRSTALTELKSLLDNFRDAANFLRNPPGVGNAADNVFKHVISNVVASNGVTGSNYLTVTAEPGVGARSFYIDEITSIAQAARQKTGTFAIADADTSVVNAAPAAGEFGIGTFTVNGADITLEDGDTLNEVAGKFNAVKSTTGIEASVVKLSDGNFTLLFNATATGVEAAFDLGDIGTVTSDVDGVLDQLTFTTTQTASDAEFVLDGVTITRSTNSIGDAVNGVTFNLIQDTLDESLVNEAEISISLTPDVELAKAGIINFANAYNDLRTFYATQTQSNDDGTTSEDSVLATNSTLRSIMNAVSGEIAQIVDGISTSPNRLSDLGVTSIDFPATDETPLVRNALTIDEAKLTAALQSNFDAVSKVFGTDFTSSNPNVVLFKNSNSVSITDFTLTVTPGSNIFQATYNNGSGDVTIDLTGTEISTGSGYKLTGQAGTVLEGLELIYAGSEDSVSTIHITKGIASLIYNSTNNYLTVDTGAVDVELEALQDSTTKLQDDIDDINEQVEKFREQLLIKFGELERAISTVNTLLESLQAQADARNNG